MLAALDPDEFDVGADHVFAARNERQIGYLGGQDHLTGRGVSEEQVIDGEAILIPRKARPPVVFAWGSTSRSNTGTPSIATAAARLMAVVVLPTPPFWLTMAMTLLRGVGPGV